MIPALAIFGGSTTLVLVGVVVWLTYRASKAKDAESTALDLLRGQRDVSAEWESKYKATAAKLVVAADSLEREKFLRLTAETARNIAQARLANEIRKRIPTATNEEIQEITNDTFSALAIAPRPVDGVPQSGPRRSEAGPDALIDPWASVQPAAAPK